jgi:hypothetical protein
MSMRKVLRRAAPVALVATLGLAPGARAANSSSQGGTIGPVPTCQMFQSWEKRPDTLHVQSMALTGSVSCTGMPPQNFDVDLSIEVDDLMTPLAPPVVHQSAGFSESDTPDTPSVSLALNPVIDAPKVGHEYESKVVITYLWDTSGMQSLPKECKQTGPSPFDSGPPSGFTPSGITCEYDQLTWIL